MKKILYKRRLFFITRIWIQSNIVIVLTLFGSSCKKFIEVGLPKDKVTSVPVFDNDQTAVSAILGIYTDMMSTSLFYTSGGTTIYTGLTSDELFNTNININSQNEFFQNSISINNSSNANDIWTRAYKHIYQANACIEGISKSSGLTVKTKRQLLGEAKFIRAYIYFYLVNFYSDVPLLTTTDYRVNASMGRISADKVYDQIIEDLSDAVSLLEDAYPSVGRVRPNKWAASSLLARVYLYLGKWNKAETESSGVINSGIYILENNLNNTFLATSHEAIWQLMPVASGFQTTEARQFIPTTATTSKPAFAMTSSLSSAFENNDLRKANWVRNKIVSGEIFYYPYKYKIRDLNLPLTEHYMMLRYAELYLIRAEALIMQDKLTDGKADINYIRGRAGLPNTLASDKPSLLDAIEKERRFEFFAEWGHRWFDLKRTNRADAVFGISKPGWQSTDILFPIPGSQILLNPSLSQNAGY